MAKRATKQTAKRKSKVSATRTINPLHFEDLEPHRFEDLVRQLAYGFRSWGRLEATGRQGKDEGTDIRGLELVTGKQETEAEEEEETIRPILEGREWRIQCKRYKTINQKLMRNIVAETIPDPHNPPYGLIIAAACDVSAATMAAFHDERIKQGIIEGHLWTKAHLEDLLFKPENDHLLFAYFGISLVVRQRSRLQQVQSTLAVKRKLLRAFKKERLWELRHTRLIIRDVEDTTYPVRHGEEDVFEILPWFRAEIVEPFSWGLIIYRHRFEGSVKEDGTWDFLPNSSLVGEEFYVPARKMFALMPQNELSHIEIHRILPYTSILEVDPLDYDFRDEDITLFCRYAGEAGPFEDARLNFYSSRKYLDQKMHRSIFGPFVDECIKEGKLNREDVEKISFINKE